MSTNIWFGIGRKSIMKCTPVTAPKAMVTYKIVIRKGDPFGEAVWISIRWTPFERPFWAPNFCKEGSKDSVKSPQQFKMEIHTFSLSVFFLGAMRGFWRVLSLLEFRKPFLADLMKTSSSTSSLSVSSSRLSFDGSLFLIPLVLVSISAEMSETLVYRLKYEYLKTHLPDY